MISFRDLNLIEERLKTVFVTKDDLAESITALKNDLFDKIDPILKEVTASR